MFTDVSPCRGFVVLSGSSLFRIQSEEANLATWVMECEITSGCRGTSASSKTGQKG